MKKITLTIFLFICGFVTLAQTVFVTEQNYQQLKKNGQIKPNVNYQFINKLANISSTTSATNTNVNDVTQGLPSAKTTTAGGCQCMVPVDPTFSVVPITSGSAPDYRNDDGSTALIPLGFNFCFYGTTYNSCYINNNGNISFGSPYSTFSSNPFPDAGFVMIAPFWGDVDTRNLASGLPYFKKTATSLIVKWSNVGYYSSYADKLNDFQLIITDGTDPMLPNGNNVAFCYGDMQWTTGDASDGVNGFGGTPATVGVNKGDGTNYIQIGRFDQPGASYDGPYGLNDGVSFLDNKSYFFNTCGTNNNLPPIVQDATGGGSTCGDTIRICALGDTLVYTTTFLAPENTQSITINGSAPTLGSSFQPLGVTTSTAGTTTYAWMVVATPTVTGIHTVVVTGTDNGAPPLSSSATYFIKIQNLPVPQPTLSIAPAGTVCATPGATVSLVNFPDYDNVYWSTGASGNSIIANTTGIYYVTVEKLGCYKSSSDTVTVFPNPVPTVLGPFNYCAPAANATISVNPPLAGMPAYSTYTWTPGGIGTPTAGLTGTAGGTSYTVSVTDINGCKGAKSFTVSSASPTATISSNPLSICGAGTTTLTASITGATSYSWSNGANTQSTTVTAAGSYSVLITANSCTTSASTNITINPTPTVTLPPTVGLCSGANAIVSVSSFSPSGAYTYTWSNGSNASSLSVTTTTVLTLQVTNTASGCISTISNSCNVVAAANPTVTMPSTPIIFCNGANAILTPTVGGGTPAYNYTWTPLALGTNSTATTNSVGTFTVLVSDQNLCKGTATVATVKSTPTVGLSSADLVICPSECSKIKAIGTSSFTPFTYAWSNSTVYVGDSTLMCSAGVVTITFTDNKGCSATSTITVVDDVIPVASFTASPGSPVVPGQIITFTNTSTVPSGTINPGSWTFGDGGSANGNVVSYSYSGAGSFPVTMIVTGSSGCADTVTIVYYVDAILNIPNVITPNGDNVNDYLKFKNLQFFGLNNIAIFNRWGKKIYEQENYKNDWNGSGLSDGTYFFILNVPEASPSTYNGSFQLIR